MLVVLPGTTEQKQIAEVLSSLDDKIELNRKINANLEKLASSLFKKWFVDIGDELPEGWKDTTLGEFVPIKTGKKDANIAIQDGQYPFFTCSQDVLKTNVYSFDASALLLAGNGDFSVKWYEGKFEAYQRTYVLVPHKKELLGFLYYLVKYFLDDITAGHRGSVIRFITKGMIEDYKIRVPTSKVLEEKAKIFYEINQSIDFYKREIENLIQIRDSLLPRLMSGKIRVN
jgi:type I restriction enzyme S subunit